ncbi:four helix bundle protein [Runella defluvii]|uniref:Four helix bundle protein n=1 Tax=Runella defluvii TaxID=370973 RepID=A0A7W5ZN54_9BACT|nr:four helix bundle protein [Runella defluvii]MBB3840425.1 four helix bundle protein [Runella defluvii]
MPASHFKELSVYKKAFELAMLIYTISKGFPQEEKYALTDQIRRSSRSVCANLGEAFRKRRYPAHFISKVSDADMENTETQVWLDFSLACRYVSKAQFEDLSLKSDEIGRLLNHMMAFPEKY